MFCLVWCQGDVLFGVCDLTRLCVGCDWVICVTWLVYVCDTLYGRLCRVHSGTYDLCVCVTLLMHTCDVTRSYVWRDLLVCVWRDSFICVTLCMEDSVTYILERMTCVCVWRYLFIRVMWLVHMCDVTDWYVWRASFKCMTLCMEDSVEYILVCMTRVCVWHYLFIRVMWLVDMCDVTRLCVFRFVWKTLASTIGYIWFGYIWLVKCVTLLIHTCDVTRSYVWCDSFICVPLCMEDSVTCILVKKCSWQSLP